MTVERAVQHTIASSMELVHQTSEAVPKAWGALAARGVVTFRELVGRPPSAEERRAIWTLLWDGARRAHRNTSASSCGHEIAADDHAICEVCRGMLLCMECARSHYCTRECAARGCIAGLCVKEVRDGSVAEKYGVG